MEGMNRRDFLKKLGAVAAAPAIDAIASSAEAAEGKGATVTEIFSLLEMRSRFQLGTSTMIDAEEIGKGIAEAGPRRIIFEARLATAVSMRLKEIAVDLQNVGASERGRVWDRVQKADALIQSLGLPPTVSVMIDKDIEAIRKLVQRDA